ncbi:MAG TPA: DUF202 domain-containing protein [Chitinophagaceae bacterium]|nr:DUF202 domain-containing protein [Chitinophagaceae bacterium]
MENNHQNKVLKIQQELLALSKQRTNYSAFRTYLNAERTLSVWVRTSLSIMVFGIAIDRFGLIIRGLSYHPNSLLGHPSTPTSIMGLGVVIFSVIMAFFSGLRFITFSRRYKKEFPLPRKHRIWLPPTYAFMIVLFGSILALFLWGIY